MSKFFTQYDKVVNLYEPKNSGKILIDDAPYIPSKQLIEGMITAGRNLEAFRRGMNGYESDEEALDGYDPTLDYDYEDMDAKRDSSAVLERLSESQKKSDKTPEEKKPEAPETSPEEKPVDNPA